jgi:cbb3-type cytochrome oxidase subunit 3
LIGWVINSLLTLIFYAGIYLVYLTIKRKDIFKTIRNLQSLLAS